MHLRSGREPVSAHRAGSAPASMRLQAIHGGHRQEML